MDIYRRNNKVQDNLISTLEIYTWIKKYLYFIYEFLLYLYLVMKTEVFMTG